VFRYMETPPPIADQMDNEGNSGNDWEMPTESVHAGEMHDASGAHIDPIHMTSTYIFEDSNAIKSWGTGESGAHVYSRVGNPNREALARKLSALESSRSV